VRMKGCCSSLIGTRRFQITWGRNDLMAEV
jgi:hypothetical protein